MASRRWVLSLPLVGAAAAAVPAGHVDAAAAGDAALGIGLETWPYPAPVQFLPLVMAGQSVRMAFMDVAPARPNGRTILLLHGKNFDSSYWAGPITWLTRAGFRVVVPDQIGFNKSAKPDLAYRFEDLAANTWALADHLGLERVTVFGHSTGGALAIRMAAAHGERVEQLVLEDPIGLVDIASVVPAQTTETLVAAEHRYTDETYRAFIAHFFARLAPAQYEPFVTWRMRVAKSGEFDRFARASALTYQMIYHEPARPFCAALTMPVLLTAGTKDRSAPLAAYASPEARAHMQTIPEAVREVVRTLPHGHLEEFDGCGHVPHMEAPDAFRSALLRFLAAA